MSGTLLYDGHTFKKLALTSGMLSQSGLTTFNAAACVDSIAFTELAFYTAS